MAKTKKTAVKKVNSKTYTFTAPMERLTGDNTWYFIEFPYDVVKEFGTKGRVRMKCVINGIAADRALMPTKSGYHMIILGGDIRRAAKLKKQGDLVHIELWADPEPDKVTIPEALAETLDFMPEFKAGWDKLTPGIQRSMCYWVASAKTEPTQAKRIAELLRRFETGHVNFGGRTKKI
ncbi:MAG: DUF1905 domain-containing protein [Flavobacteriales bacterium]|nr:DUF1905 domain-containing protein [Flavobacteriales bacterium]